MTGFFMQSKAFSNFLRCKLSPTNPFPTRSRHQPNPIPAYLTEPFWFPRFALELEVLEFSRFWKSNRRFDRVVLFRHCNGRLKIRFPAYSIAETNSKWFIITADLCHVHKAVFDSRASNTGAATRSFTDKHRRERARRTCSCDYDFSPIHLVFRKIKAWQTRIFFFF